MTSRSNEKKPKISYRGAILAALFALIVLVGGGIAWASRTEIAGAVIGSGAVTVVGKPKSIQHLDGGIVKAIHVASGDRVAAGDVLVELDETMIAANLAIYRSRLRDALALRSRLRADVADLPEMETPSDIVERYQLGEFATAMEQQRLVRAASSLTRDAQLRRNDEKIAQSENQIVGLQNMIVEERAQIASYEDEHRAIATLVRKKLTAKSRLLSLERATADMRGQIAENEAEIARIRNMIAETHLAKLQLQREFREKVAADLDAAETKADELMQQIEATAKQLSRVAITAPVAGIVHELSTYTIGGVVQPGQTLMQIIPQTGEYEIDLSVDTRSIDQIHVGQEVTVRFPAFHARTTPELVGHVRSMSPSSVTDEKSGISFYRVVVDLDGGEVARLGGKVLISGMPVEGFIRTDDRTVLSFLTKPLIDNLRWAFREE